MKLFHSLMPNGRWSEKFLKDDALNNSSQRSTICLTSHVKKIEPTRSVLRTLKELTHIIRSSHFLTIVESLEFSLSADFWGFNHFRHHQIFWITCPKYIHHLWSDDRCWKLNSIKVCWLKGNIGWPEQRDDRPAERCRPESPIGFVICRQIITSCLHFSSGGRWPLNMIFAIKEYWNVRKPSLVKFLLGKFFKSWNVRFFNLLVLMLERIPTKYKSFSFEPNGAILQWWAWSRALMTCSGVSMNRVRASGAFVATT